MQETKKQQVVIVGVSNFHLAIAEAVLNSQDHELIAFCDPDWVNVGQFFSFTPVLDVITLEAMFQSGTVDKIIVFDNDVTCGSTNFFNSIKNLMDCGINDKVYAVPDWYFQPFKDSNQFTARSHLIKLDLTKGVSNHMVETNYHNKCTFSCKGCLAVAPLGDESKPLETYRKDVLRLGELFCHLTAFCLADGEPFLDPDLSEKIKIARQAFLSARIGIFSNASLILTNPKKLENVFQAMNEYHAFLIISAYPPTFKQREQLVKILEKYDVCYRFSTDTLAPNCEIEPVRKFFKKLTLSPENNPIAEFTLCDKTTCRTLEPGGKVRMCRIPILIDQLQNHFDVKFEGFDDMVDDLYIDIHNTELSGWEIAEFFNSPSPVCAYCSHARMEWFDWQQQSPKDMRLEDFIVG